MVNSKLKGARLEREVAQVFADMGWRAYRTQQFQGVGSDGDVVLEDAPGLHCEVKGRKQLTIYNWLDQAIRDSRGKKLPAVVCKGDRREWLLVVQLDRLPEFLSQMMEARRAVPQTQACEDPDTESQA